MKAKIIFSSLLLIGALAIGSWLAITIARNMFIEHKQGHDNSDFFMHNISYVQMDANGNIQKQLIAAKMTHLLATETYLFTSPHLVMVGNDKLPWHISADQGSSKDDVSEVYLWDNVNLKQRAESNVQENAQREAQNKKSTQSGTNIITSAATIYPKKKLAVTDKPLTIIQGSNIVNATGAKINLQNSTVKLLSQVKGKYESK